MRTKDVSPPSETEALSGAHRAGGSGSTRTGGRGALADPAGARGGGCVPRRDAGRVGRANRAVGLRNGWNSATLLRLRRCDGGSGAEELIVHHALRPSEAAASNLSVSAMSPAETA